MNTSIRNQAERVTSNYDEIDSGTMQIPFGVHAGKELSEVPRNYKIWLLTQTLRSYPALYAELRLHVINLLKAEARAADLAKFHGGLEQIARMGSDEDLA